MKTSKGSVNCGSQCKNVRRHDTSLPLFPGMFAGWAVMDIDNHMEEQGGKKFPSTF